MPTPVIIGVGDFKNQSDQLREDGSDEPAALILKAIDCAVRDTGLDVQLAEKLQSSIDSIDVVRPWAWPYPDLASLLAERLGVSNVKHKLVSPHGGNNPAKMLDDASRRVSMGAVKVAIVCGGEALDSLNRYIKAQQFPPPGWTAVDGDTFASNALRPPSEKGLKGVHGVGAPIQVYPLYENAFRAHYKQSFHQNHNESAQLYANFAKVSETNKFSWNYGKAETKESIGTVTPRNRMICLPYPLLMNAFNAINLAGACIVTSAEFAASLGISKDQFIYPLGGAGTSESDDFWLRANFYSSPAISRSLDTGLSISDLTKDQIDVYDFYSCFPIVPKVACRHLGISTTDHAKPITLLGGLTSFGGAGNNYSMHAITEMTRYLRRGEGHNGLILANGGVMTYQHVVCLSTRPRSSAYPAKAPLPEHVTDVSVPDFDARPPENSPAVIETYTVDFHRKGSPLRGHIVGRLEDGSGKRFIANHADEATLKALARTDGSEVVGRKGVVKWDKGKEGKNLFELVDTIQNKL